MLMRSDTSRYWNVPFEREDGSAMLDKNREYYKCIEKKDYDTLEACARHAMANRNHAAFAHFVFEHTRSAQKIFGDRLSEYIEKYLNP